MSDEVRVWAPARDAGVPSEETRFPKAAVGATATRSTDDELASLAELMFERPEDLACGAVVGTAGVPLERSPYPHFVVPRFLPQAAADAFLDWLESPAAPWRAMTAELYHHHVLALDGVDAPPRVRAWLSPTAIALVRTVAEKTFGVVVSPLVGLSALRWRSGDGVAIHTDQEPGELDTHRIVVQLVRDAEIGSSEGAMLMFKGPRPEDLDRVLPRAHDTAFGFEISERSFHAVGETKTLETFALVYSFAALR